MPSGSACSVGKLLLVAVALVAGACRGGGVSTRAQIHVDNGAGVARPDVVLLSWLDERGYRFRESTVPVGVARSGDGGRLATVAIDITTDRQVVRRVVARGMRKGDPRPLSEGAARVIVPAGVVTDVVLVLESGLRPDEDGDGAPDVIDDCPRVSNPEQEPCSPDERDRDAGVADGPIERPADSDSTAAPVDAREAGAGAPEAGTGAPEAGTMDGPREAPADVGRDTPVDTPIAPARDGPADLSGGPADGLPDAQFAGTLTVTVEPVMNVVNLTTEGAVDWVHWTSASQINRKRNVPSELGNYTAIGTIDPQPADGTSRVSFSWSDGSPTLTSSNQDDSVFVTGVGNGYELSLSAGRAVRTLRLFVALTRARGKLTATLSDGSAPAYEDSSMQADAGTNAAYTIRFAAASAGARLVVRWTMLEDAGSGRLIMKAAALR